jgi:GH35 family endo-1,4-beta-xylanase
MRYSIVFWLLPFLSGADPLDEAIRAHRTGTLIIQARPGAQISVEQLKHEFWFGATLPTGMFEGRMSAADIAKFEEIFPQLFNAGVIESAFKWHDMEREHGSVRYAVVDAMLRWAAARQIPLRGHCIYWGIPNRVQPWLKALSDDELRSELARRGRSVAARYRGQFAEYDLNNEMIHANYYEQRLGETITPQMARWVLEGDPAARLYVNDYDITTGNRLDDYVRHIRKLLDQGVPLAGIGVQGHLHGDSFDPAALQRSLDVLAQFRLPIRITEFNFPGQRSRYYRDPEARKLPLSPAEEEAKAKALREYFRICFAHPAVSGVLLWGFWEGANWIPQSSLFRRDWSPTPAAEAYRDLVTREWRTRWSGGAGPDGRAEVRAIFGSYRITIDGKERLLEFPKAAGRLLVSAE